VTTLTTDNVRAWVGFEPTIPAGERPQAYTLDRGSTGTGKLVLDSIYCHLIYYTAKSLITLAGRAAAMSRD